MEATKHPASAERDWRLQAITTTAAPHTGADGREFPAGSPVVLINPMAFSSGVLWAPVPSAPALLLSLASRLARSATEGLARLSALSPGNGPGERVVLKGDEQCFFDTLEDLIGCVVFSHTALEAFANALIPDDFRFEAERDDRRCTEVYTKAQIERHMALERKLDYILPGICGVKSPKGTKLWKDYTEMRDRRDRLVHLKSIDMVEVKPQQGALFRKHLWSLLLSAGAVKFPATARDLMLHFSTGDAPRWLRKCKIG